MDQQTKDAFTAEALQKFPTMFKKQEQDLLYSYKKGWRRVQPLSECHARIEGFDVCVIISGSKVKRCKV